MKAVFVEMHVVLWGRTIHEQNATCERLLEIHALKLDC